MISYGYNYYFLKTTILSLIQNLKQFHGYYVKSIISTFSKYLLNLLYFDYFVYE